MTQSIVIQIGQCGNQIGSRFWDLAVKEHGFVNKNNENDNGLSTFFLNKTMNSYSNSFNNKISSLKARAVLIDMEEGVVNSIMKSSIRNLFDHKQLITDVSGSGNNWAVGNLEYGMKYHDNISETIRKSVELCDCLQCFFILHSMGGGTGSGLGTHVTEMLADEYSEAYRFVNSVFPSDDDDDVITSPYNSVLAMNKLTEFADCVMPIENNSLIQMVKSYNKYSEEKSSNIPRKPFDSMNDIVANLLLNLTSSSRFEGTLNVDLNEISMNLVPFPRLHYLIAAQSPLVCPETRINSLIQPRRIDQIFADSFSRDFQMLDVEPKAHTYLACALLVRGKVEISDIRRNIDKYRNNLRFVHWNKEGWKVGHCGVPPRGQKYSLLNLSNNTSVHKTFEGLLSKFNKLYKRKAHIHHYTQVDGFENDMFAQSIESLKKLQKDYQQLEKQSENANSISLSNNIPRLQIAD